MRQRCLRQFHQALLDNVENLRPILVHEVGAPVAITSGPQLEMPMLQIVGWYADLLDSYEFTEDLGDREAFGLNSHRWVEKEAAGVVSAIIAYNYPVQLALAKLAPALAAGCTVVLKGAPDTPWAALALGKLIAESTDMPPGVVNILTSSDNAVGAEMTAHPDVDVITFTGSTPVGRQIMAAASATLKRTFLELRRQVGDGAARRRRCRRGGDDVRLRGDLSQRSGMRHHVASGRAAPAVRRRC